MLATSVATVLLAFAHTYPQILARRARRRPCRRLVRRRRRLRVALLPAAAAGHRARHLRCRQRRRRRDEVRCAVRPLGVGLAGGRAHLGRGSGDHGRDVLADHRRRPGARRAAQDRCRRQALHAGAVGAARRARLALRLLLLLRVRRLRRAGALAAALSDRRLWLRHRHRRHDRRAVFDSRQHLPRLRRRPLRPHRRTHGDVLEPRRLRRCDARPLAAADHLRRARHQGRHRLAPRDSAWPASSSPPSCSASS